MAITWTMGENGGKNRTEDKGFSGKEERNREIKGIRDNAREKKSHLFLLAFHRWYKSFDLCD